VSELRDHSLADLDSFVARSLTGNPRNRFASAKEMQDELRRIFENTKRGGTSTARESTTIQAQNSAVPPSGTGPNVSVPGGALPNFIPPMSPPHAAPRGTGPSGSFRAAPAASASGQSPMASTMMGGGSAGAGPESPREQTLSTDAPTATKTERPNIPGSDQFGDETETDRKFFDVAPYQDPASSSRMQAARARFDEASADNPHKTVPPRAVPATLAQPPTAQGFQPMRLTPIDDEFEEATEARNAVYNPEQTRDPNKTPLPPVPEEETQQLQMTPEMRAKIEAHYAQGAGQTPPRPPMQSEMDSIPPPTKRLDK
jgi:hypothetical protein